MAVALHGSLRDFGISEVFQLIGQQRKTGILEIHSEERRSQLLFKDGSIVRAAPAGAHADASLGEMLVRVGLLTRERLDELERAREQSLRPLLSLVEERTDLGREQLAEIEDLLTRETIFDVLRWSEGSFHFSAGALDHDCDASRLLAAEQVLMDGLRMVDEWQTFAHRVPGEDAVFQRAGRFDDHPGRAAGDDRRLARAERVFMLVDGRLPVRRIIDLSRLGTFECTRVLAELRDLGLIEPLDPDKVARRRPRVPRVALPENPGRLAVSTLLPLLLLAAVAAFSHRPHPASALPGVGAVVHDPVAEARATFGALRLRNAIDAFRYAEGRPPHALQELVDRGFLAQSALTDPDGRPYYYARHGERVLLLAPPQ